MSAADVQDQMLQRDYKVHRRPPEADFFVMVWLGMMAWDVVAKAVYKGLAVTERARAYPHAGHSRAGDEGVHIRTGPPAVGGAARAVHASV